VEGGALGDGFAAHGGGSSNVKWMEMANNGRGGYGGSNVMLMRTESSTDTLVAMLASCSPGCVDRSVLRPSQTTVACSSGG
jgi:hypothetical protein